MRVNTLLRNDLFVALELKMIVAIVDDMRRRR